MLKKVILLLVKEYCLMKDQIGENLNVRVDLMIKRVNQLLLHQYYFKKDPIKENSDY